MTQTMISTAKMTIFTRFDYFRYYLPFSAGITDIIVLRIAYFDET